MQGNRIHSLGEILKSRINAPLVWGILLLTLALTVLFYYSQKQQMDVYVRYLDTLSDYKFFSGRVMQKMERVRVASEGNSEELMSSLRGLREIAVSVYAASENDRSIVWMPPEREFSEFENSVLVWIASIKRYVPERASWLDSAMNLVVTLNRWNLEIAEPLVKNLDSARLGFAILSDSAWKGKLPDSLWLRYESILLWNAKIAELWNRVAGDRVLVQCDNLAQSFKIQSLKNREIKFWTQQVFYLISIVLLLFTLFFAVRSRK